MEHIYRGCMNLSSYSLNLRRPPGDGRSVSCNVFIDTHVNPEQVVYVYF